MSFADEKIPIESQLMLDYANGLPFKGVLDKYRLYLSEYLEDRTDCWSCSGYLEDM